MFVSRLFDRRALIGLVAGFITVILVSNLGVRYVCSVTPFDCPQAWPISLFYPMIPQGWHVGLALALSLGFYPLARLLDRRGYPLVGVIGLALVLAAGTNLLKGVDIGYIEPMTHRNQQYYNEALKIDDPVQYIRDYEALQPTLGKHAQTHPPGAVLTLWALQKIFVRPEWISLALGWLAMSVTLFFAHRVFLRLFEEGALARYSVLLLAVIPAVQIYMIATIDAWVAALLTATLYFFLSAGACQSQPEIRRMPYMPSLHLLGASLCLFYALFINIPAVVILPILGGYELFRQRRVWQTATLSCGIALAFALLYLFLDFNIIAVFRHAEQYENPEGFALLVDPVNYGFTRLECVAEILVFFGPFLLALIYQGWSALRRDFPAAWTLLALLLVTLLIVFLIGTYRTGETARPLMFLYVYALFPVLAILRDVRAGETERVSLLMLVFSQAVYMQLFGHYLW